MTDSADQSAPDKPELDLSGRQLGDFRLLRRLGRGAMAEVYLAEQGSLRRQVAIKILRSDLARDETYVKRFHNEAQAAASLVHANIVQIHDVGCVEGIHYIAQEYVPGQNLREYMARRGPPDLRLSLAIMRQVAAALHKAAERGIVHRDIKPENIMLANTGEVKVADFGLARLVNDGAVNLTQVGVTMGTPLYMSPEQVEGRALDPRSDIYSFGVTCYQMLAGLPPFRGDTALAVAVQHLQSQPARLEDQRPDLPGGLARIVHKMLAKDPAQRYASARDLLRELRALRLEGEAEPWSEEELGGIDLDTQPLVARTEATQRLDSLMKSTGMYVTRRRRRAFVGWIAGTVAAFSLGGALAWGTREPFLLAGVESKEAVPRQESARLQFQMAEYPPSEEAYLAVERYFPKERFTDQESEYYRARAQEELALIYIQQPDQLDRAKAIFEELSTMTEKEFEAYGLAGLGVIYWMQRDYEKSAQALKELTPMNRELAQRRRMQNLVLRAIADTRRKMDEQSNAAWEAWEKQLAEDEGADG